MDADAQAAIKSEPTHWPTPSQKALEQQLLTDHYVHTWGWAVYRPDPATKANCVAFMSGYGDGIYSSYWGLDASGTPLCSSAIPLPQLVTLLVSWSKWSGTLK